MSKLFPLPDNTIIMLAADLGTVDHYPHTPGMTVLQLFTETHGDRSIKNYRLRIRQIFEEDESRSADPETEIMDKEMVSFQPLRMSK